MIGEVAEKQKDVAALCARFHVQLLELFGSAARGETFDTEQSDLDFLVIFHPLQSGERAESYFGLREALEDLFGRSIDLVMVRAVRNRYFLEAISRDRVALYAA